MTDATRHTNGAARLAASPFQPAPAATGGLGRSSRALGEGRLR
jgi:hypothetical protein